MNHQAFFSHICVRLNILRFTRLQKRTFFIDCIVKILKPLTHYCVSTHVSTAYQDTKGTSRVRRTNVSIRSIYSLIRSSYMYFSYAEMLRFFMCALKNSWHVRGSSDTGYIRHTYVVHTKSTWQVRRRYVAQTPDTPHVRRG